MILSRPGHVSLRPNVLVGAGEKRDELAISRIGLEADGSKIARHLHSFPTECRLRQLTRKVVDMMSSSRHTCKGLAVLWFLVSSWPW